MKRMVLISVVPAAILFAGCIHTHETVYRDVSRTPVEFENETAGRIFYEALSRRPHSGDRQESKTEVSLPLVFSNEHRVVHGPNEAFNQAVAEADTNKDGKITEVEARIFGGK
jgi:predicted small secreted protein